ncbi:hypothetical protein KQH54_02155 [bacterium]|nr:hypothetical protein [bacterium]
MSDSPVIELYTLLDHTKNSLGDFGSLTGGEISIALVEYNMVFSDGGSTTRFIPGQTSFAPIQLSRFLSPGCEDSYNIFLEASGGAVNYQNMTILAKDETKQDRVLWDLTNVLLTAIGGFSYNSYQATASAKFKITLQAELIEMSYL